MALCVFGQPCPLLFQSTSHFQKVFHPFLSKTGFLILPKSKDMRNYLHFLSWLFFFSTLSTISWYDYRPDGTIWQIQTIKKWSLWQRTCFWEFSQLSDNTCKSTWFAVIAVISRRNGIAPAGPRHVLHIYLQEGRERYQVSLSMWWNKYWEGSHGHNSLPNCHKENRKQFAVSGSWQCNYCEPKHQR